MNTPEVPSATAGDAGLPPKPEARRSSTTSLPSLAASSLHDRPASLPPPPGTLPPPSSMDKSSNSSDSRHLLRKSLHHRKDSLTPAEHGFLEELCMHGNEIEVTLAHQRLQDSELFFENNSEWEPSSDTDLLANTNATMVVLDQIPLATTSHNSPSLPTTSGSVGSLLGSERRQELLEQRKKSAVHDKIWRAHENGLAVTKAASRRSVFQRQQSLGSSLGRHRRRASATAYRAQDIFRSNALDASHHSRTSVDAGSRYFQEFKMDSSSHSTGRLMLDDVVRSDNNRRHRRFLTASDRLEYPLDSKSSAAAGMGEGMARRSSLRLPRSKPTLRRMQSESNASRKSVSFKELPRVTPKARAISDDKELSKESGPPAVPPQIGLGTPVRSEGSISTFGGAQSSLSSSIPSIHHAHPVQSPQPSVKSIASSGIPSIHHAHPVQSPQPSVKSVASSGIPSIHHAHPVQSPQASTRSGVPSIHLAHPVRSQSFRSRASSITSQGDFSASYCEETRDPSESEEKKITDEWLAATASSSSLEIPDKVVISNTAMNANEVLSPDDLVAMDRNTQLLTHGDVENARRNLPKPVFLRKASAAHYEEEGIEVADWDIRMTHSTPSPGRNMDSLFSFGDSIYENSNNNNSSSRGFSRQSSSFDETVSYGRISTIFRRSSIPRSFSEEDMAGIFLGGSLRLFRESSSLREAKPTSLADFDTVETDDMASWQMSEEDEDDLDYYDSWKVIDDEYANGYGGGGTLPFVILGTSADDLDSHPHVLSPPLMESLQNFLPMAITGENLWMKYSLVRDGASMHTLLQYARGAKYSFLALETVDGEVFGAFTAEPWRKNWNYFGSGESFLWRLRQSRHTLTHSILDQAHLESEIDVFPFTGQNANIQLCTHDKLAVGGGAGGGSDPGDSDPSVADFEWGFGLTIESDLLIGTSSPCLTFGSPSLSRVHSDGSHFEIINLELWTLTPCATEEEASKLELGKLFLEKHVK